ncbi:MAG TPA: rhomboid family intramembrane serine protease, partial [Phycisphaerae bacterium]|nr:rhomboid family intramembrane serine protease [Phycisphaerae bacterium]
MGLHDRPYWKDSDQTGGGSGGMSLGMPKPTRMVKYLLIINLAAFLAQVFLEVTLKFRLSTIFGATVGGFWQLWRYVTFQFLHDPRSLWHIGLNLLGLYMFGTPLEGRWGSRRFLTFYLTCGAVAGVAYVVMGGVLALPHGIPLIGASGGVYGILLACAVLFPNFRVILVLFPVPIRLAAVIIFGGM